MSIVDEVRKIVEKQARQKSNIFDVTGFVHVKKVVEIAEKLARQRKTDLEMISIAAWLHDYATFVSKEYGDNHEAKGAEYAEEILNKLKYPRDKIEIIKDAIYCHRGSKNRPKKTSVAKCLADADAMAHFLSIPSLFYLAYITYEIKDVKKARDFVRGKLSRSWQKISLDGRRMIQSQHDVAEIILEGKI